MTLTDILLSNPAGKEVKERKVGKKMLFSDPTCIFFCLELYMATKLPKV